MPIRFLHTSDWQLGMTRHFLSPEAQARYHDDQLAAIAAMAGAAREHGCAFAVVAGDVFEHVKPARAVLARSAEALGAFDLPVFLLPGNHDPDSPAGPWTAATFRERCPSNVTVLTDTCPAAADGVPVEVIGAPWRAKRPPRNPLEDLLSTFPAPEPGITRVVVAHGGLDTFAPGSSDPALLRRDAVERAARDGLFHYLALGDRHSATPVGDTGAVWYSGAPIATDFDETEPNRALVVELEAGAPPRVTSIPVGTWSWRSIDVRLDGPEDVAAFQARLDAWPDKARSVIQCTFTGTLGFAARAELDRVVDENRDLFASLEESERHGRLAIVAEGADLGELGLTGFASDALEELMAMQDGDGAHAQAARDAAMLLYRLASPA